ncbi:metallophosphoesterase [Hyalangium sp.]|uniref:metallophosphoesterase n=1 Tax=Hyalangium sp. TaxID=2028555 RepID=UPI002D45E7D1|nr:metallophosphoesterase [Hyalangium sp.]HYH99958.1 metallophosphoesterase [Hyalangium sp.]
MRGDTALVAFRLDANCTPEVHYGTQGALSTVVRSADSGRIHAVELKGLTPSTEYTYQVHACGAQTATKRFRTAPVEGTRRVHFAAVGDSGTGGERQRAVARAMLERRPELFLGLGDNAYEAGTEEEIQNNLFAPLAELVAEVPFYPVAGNHEYVTNQSQPYLDNMYLPTSPSGGERYYSFDWGFVHFVGLDSSCALGLATADRCTLAAQKAWLEQDLAASQTAWKIVYFHHATWSTGAWGSALKMRSEFAPIFEKHGVDLVLTGHDHHYERTRPMIGDAVAPAGQNGVTYLVVGGGGANLRYISSKQPEWSVTRNNKVHGFLDVDVTGGTLLGRLLTPEGEVVDSFTLTKQLPPEEPPRINLIVEGQRGVAPHQALFRAELPSPGVAVRWDFGDGATSEGAEVKHVYAQPGEYTVTATATTPTGGASSTSTTQISVSAAGTGGTPTDPGAPNPGDTQPPVASGPGTSPGTWGDSPSAGCSAIPVGALLPLGALALAGLLRRRRR